MAPPKLCDERDFVPADLQQARDLYQALIRVVSVAQARSIVMWLIMLPERTTLDRSHYVLASGYRKALAKLGEPPWGLAMTEPARLKSTATRSDSTARPRYQRVPDPNRDPDHELATVA